MPKFYEPKCFEEYYHNFLGERLSNRYYSYIDPDCVEDIRKTDFYNDLTDFLNEQEEKCIEKEEDRYLYLPPLYAPKTENWLENHEEYRGHKDKMDEKKIAVLKVKDGKWQLCFCLTSDQFGFSAAEDIYEKGDERYPLAKLLYSCEGKCGDERKEIIGRITEYVKNTRTLGGSFLWPVHPEGRKERECSYNKRRGVGNYLEDRVDLTLLEVKHALDCAEGEKCDYKEYEKDVLYKEYENDATNMREWLTHFGTFTKFVEYFMLEPFCKVKPAAKGSCEYIPVNIIDGNGIKQKKEEIRSIVKVKNLRGEEILNMLDRLEGMILVRTANMENAVKSYRENWKGKGAEKG